jgi:hypothetical protein
VFPLGSPPGVSQHFVHFSVFLDYPIMFTRSSLNFFLFFVFIACSPQHSTIANTHTTHTIFSLFCQFRSISVLIKSPSSQEHNVSHPLLKSWVMVSNIFLAAGVGCRGTPSACHLIFCNTHQTISHRDDPKIIP